MGMYIFHVGKTCADSRYSRMIGIGFSGQKVALSRIPGWEPDSYAYHGDDGQIFSNTTSGKSYGPKFGTLDVIGCGINFRTNTAFFTKNGHMLGKHSRYGDLDSTNKSRDGLSRLETQRAILSHGRHEEAWRDGPRQFRSRTLRFRYRQDGTG
jgi:hypothetical protein